jgi:UPF0716 protein FxsA
LLFKVGAQIGGPQTIFIIIATGIIGAGLAKSQGLKILTQIQTQLQTGKIPSKAIERGLMMLVGGVLLVTPGFMTDIVGILLITPISQDLIGLLLKPFLFKTLKSGNVNVFYSNQNNNAQSPFEESFTEQAPKQFEGDAIEAEYEKRD